MARGWGDALKRLRRPFGADFSASVSLAELESLSDLDLLLFPPSRNLTIPRTTETTTAAAANAHEPPPHIMAPAAATLAPIVEEIAASVAKATPPLAVSVRIRFADPNITPSQYSRNYTSSHLFRPSDRLCRGLLRRIEHCTEELITRRDSHALAHRRPGHAPSPPRYELTFALVRGSAIKPWATRSFASYQQTPLTVELADEVVRSTHRIVGLFLFHHDKGFRWTDEPVIYGGRPSCEAVAAQSQGLGYPQSLACIPASRFLEASQTFQFVPGYRIEFSFRSCCKQRKGQYEWTRNLRFNSAQDAPLNLAQSESLLWAAFDVVNSRLHGKRREVDLQHQSCEWLEGPVECDHFDDNALTIDLRVVNSLGPVHDHLTRTIHSKILLFRNPCGQDCDAFVRNVQAELASLRDKADERVSRSNDFELRILELRGQGWRAERPAKFTLDNTTSYSRRSIEAILERVQTGISDVLRGKGVAVHFTVYKRGHLILDKAIVARSQPTKPARSVDAGSPDPEIEKNVLVASLEARIHQDMEKILKDTCSLNDLPEDALPEFSASANTDSADVSAKLAEPESPAPVELAEAASPVANLTPWDRCKRFTMRAHDGKPAQRIFPLVPSKYIQRHLRQSDATSVSDVAAHPSQATRHRSTGTDTVHVIDPELFRGHDFSVPGAVKGVAVEAQAVSEDYEHSEYGATELSGAEDLVFTQESSILSEAPESVVEDTVDLECHHVGAYIPEDDQHLTITETVKDCGYDIGSAVQEDSKRLSIGRDDESVPSTPGLSHGEGPSPRDSLLMTPGVAKAAAFMADPAVSNHIEEGSQDTGPFESATFESDDDEKTPTDITVFHREHCDESSDDTFFQTKSSLDLDDDQALADLHPSTSGTPTQLPSDLAAIPEPIALLPGEVVKTTTQIPIQHMEPTPRPSTSPDHRPDLQLQPVWSRRTTERPSPIIVLRNSVSSWEDYFSVAGGRDSVDSVDSVDTVVDVATITAVTATTGQERPPAPPRRKSIPTAGYLGLHDGRATTATTPGPFGALRSALTIGRFGGGSSDGGSPALRPRTAPAMRKSFDETAATPAPLLDESPSTAKSPRLLRPYIRKRTKSVATASPRRASHHHGKAATGPRGRSKSAASAELEERLRAKGETQMLPRFMILFAGMAVASSMLNKQ